MWADGYKNIKNIDISPTAIENMLLQQEKKKTDMDCNPLKFDQI